MVGFRNLIVGIQFDLPENEIFINLLFIHFRIKWIKNESTSGLDIREL